MSFNNEIFQHFFYSLVVPLINDDKITGATFKWSEPFEAQGYADQDLLDSLTDESGHLSQILILETKASQIFTVYLSFKWNSKPLAKAYAATTPEDEKVFRFLSSLAVILLDKDKAEIMKIDSSPHHQELTQTFPYHFHDGKKNKKCFEPTSENIVQLLLEYIN